MTDMSWNETQKVDFWTLARVWVRDNDPRLAGLSNEQKDDHAGKAYRDFFERMPDQDRGMSVNEAFASFRSWYERSRFGDEPSHAETIGMSMAVNYGNVTITWTQSAVFTITGQQSRIRAYNTIYDQMRNARTEYEALNRINSDSKQNAPAVDVETFEAEKLTVEVKDGKVRYRVMGDKYSKWGVPIYDEVLTRSGIDPQSIPIAGLDLSGKVAHVLMQGGKPSKVTRLE